MNMDDREYVQDEGDTIDLVVWEEYINYVSLVRWELEADWEDWVTSVGWTD
jgi:heme-degrading monooxygenase HmoA